MIKIEKPNIDLDLLFNAVVGEVGNAILRSRYNACLPEIQLAAQEFEDKITTGQIYTIIQGTSVNGDLSAVAFKNLYDQHMVAKEVGRVYYDQILEAAPMGLCPLCGHREATALDHYLPKSLFPRLSVVPINLVPACKDCNTGKLVSYPINSEQETLHPYFDDIDLDLWLKMEVLHTNPVSILFSVERPDGWTTLLLDRVVGHFDAFGLRRLYGVQAARELSGMKKQLTRVHDNGGGLSVKKHLQDAAESWVEVRLNSWKAAFYHGLSMDDWFCEIGFSLIGA
jgi:hypothetical protein